jgi:type IV secretion system protein VirB9
MTRGVLLAVLIACQVAASRAEIVPAKGARDARVRSAEYADGEVYRIRGLVGYQVDLQFDPGEVFVGLGAGDIEGLSFVGQDNHLFLKPKAARIATNLTVLTNRRHYQIDYAAAPSRAGSLTAEVIYALRFTYPATDALRAAADLSTQRLNAELTRAGEHRVNLDYWYCGAPSLRPVAASDDGVHTRLTFAENADLPAIFVRNEDASESLLNFSMDGGDLVIHRVAQRYILRRGNLTGCVVNQGYRGSGTRLESGTVTPQVRRRVQGGTP